MSSEPLSRSWGLLKPMAMLIAVALCLLFLDAQRRREVLFIQTYTRYTVSSRPDTAFPCIDFLHKRKFRLELFCRLYFDILNCIGNYNSGRYHDYHVNMILLYTKLYYFDIGIKFWDIRKYFIRYLGTQTRWYSVL